MWELSLLLLLKGGFAGKILVVAIQPLVGSVLLAGLIGCVRDGLFQTEFCIKRLLYNSARYWPNMFLALVLNVPFWILVTTAGIAIAVLVQSKELGLALKIGLGIPLGLGGIVWVGLMGFLLPVTTILEEGSPFRIFRDVLRFGLNNAHKLFGLAVSTVLIGGGSALLVGFLFVKLEPMVAASVPFGLSTVLCRIVAGVLGVALVGGTIASLSLLYLSHIEDSSRLAGMREQISGPEADPLGTKIAVSFLLAATIALSFLLPPSAGAQTIAGNVTLNAAGETQQPVLPAHEPVAAQEPAPQGSRTADVEASASEAQKVPQAQDRASTPEPGAN
jgi:hypothetical protein